jgi:hypothetical protein
MPKIIRPGTATYTLIDGRLRHTIVTDVTDQDNIDVRLGGASENASFAADRAIVDGTRAYQYEQE